MNLDDMAIELRPRTSGEATDLGFALLRHFWWPVLIAWIPALFGLFIVGLAVYSTTELVGLALFAVWTVKPAFDRLPLFVMSRAVFGDTPGATRSLRHLASRFVSLDVWNTCTIRRLSPYRSVSIPVRELEGTSGNRRKRRLDEVLNADVKQSASSILMAGHLFEMIALVGLYLGTYMLIPSQFRPVSFLNPTNIGTLTSADVMLLGAYTLSYGFAGPLAVAGGFGQYLNRRVQLEGWDVELTFRRMTRRLGGEQPARDESISEAWKSLIIAIVTGFCVVLAPSHAALGAENASTERPDPAEAASEVLDAPEFGQKETQTVRELREAYKPDPGNNQQDSWGQALGQTLGTILEILLWGIAAAGLGVVAYMIIKSVNSTGSSSDVSTGEQPTDRTRQPGPDHSLRLPGDIAGAAEDAWREGNAVEALSLLYRGTLKGLSDRYGMQVSPGMTAFTCAHRVEQIGGPRQFMRQMAESWTSTVYADRPPSEEKIKQLIEEWRRQFQQHAEQDAAGGSL